MVHSPKANWVCNFLTTLSLCLSSIQSYNYNLHGQISGQEGNHEQPMTRIIITFMFAPFHVNLKWMINMLSYYSNDIILFMIILNVIILDIRCLFFLFVFFFWNFDNFQLDQGRVLDKVTFHNILPLTEFWFLTLLFSADVNSLVSPDLNEQAIFLSSSYLCNIVWIVDVGAGVV